MYPHDDGSLPDGMTWLGCPDSGCHSGQLTGKCPSSPSPPSSYHAWDPSHGDIWRKCGETSWTKIQCLHRFSYAEHLWSCIYVWSIFCIGVTTSVYISLHLLCIIWDIMEHMQPLDCRCKNNASWGRAPINAPNWAPYHFYSEMVGRNALYHCVSDWERTFTYRKDQWIILSNGLSCQI